MPIIPVPIHARPQPGTVYVGGSGDTPVLPFAPYRLIPVICAAGEVSTAIQVLGDSTGNASDEWVNLVAIDAAAQFPAYEVRHYYWNDATEVLPAMPTIVQATPGTKRHYAFPGLNGQTAQHLGAAVTGDIDIRVLVEPTNWVAGAVAQTFAASFFSSAPNRAWRFYYGSGSTGLHFDWSTDGSALQSAATATWTPPTGPVWVRVTLDVDNGASGHEIKFYSSTDGLTWTQRGTTTTRAGTTSIFGATGPYEIAGRSGGAELYTGKIYEVQIRNGIDGPLVAPALPEHWQRGSSVTPDPTGSPILTFVNGSHPGANIAFLADSARMAKMTPSYGQRLVLISSSHNESNTGETLRTAIAAYMTAVKARLPGTVFCGLTQNPRIAPASGRNAQAQRRIAYLSWLDSLGWFPIDTYGAFLDDTRGVAALVNSSDGLHPTSAGERLWADTIKQVLGII